MKSIKHDISLEEFQEWLSKKTVTFASSTREKKSLVCTLNGTLKVIVKDKIVWQGIQPYSALVAYNDI